MLYYISLKLLSSEVPWYLERKVLTMNHNLTLLSVGFFSSVPSFLALSLLLWSERRHKTPQNNT